MKNSGWGCSFFIICGVIFLLFAAIDLLGWIGQQPATVQALAESNQALGEAVNNLTGTVDKLVDQNHELTDDIRAGARGQRWLNAFLIFVVVILVAVILVRETKRGNERNKA